MLYNYFSITIVLPFLAKLNNKTLLKDLERKCSGLKIYKSEESPEVQNLEVSVVVSDLFFSSSSPMISLSFSFESHYVRVICIASIWRARFTRIFSRLQPAKFTILTISPLFLKINGKGSIL